MPHHHTAKATHKAFALAIAINLVFTLIEAGYAWHANSASLLADAGHNLGDVLSLVMAWLANYLQSRPATSRYSYGYKKTTILASLLNAILLLASCVFIAYEAIEKIIHPSPIASQLVMLVAFIGIIINGGSALLFQKSQHQDLNIKSAYLHLAYDALISFGVVIAAFITMLSGWLWLDPTIGLIIVFIIIWGSWGLLRASIQLSLDAVPDQINRHKVQEYFSQLPGVVAIHDLHIWSLSTSEIALTVRLVMPKLSLSDDDYKKINQDLYQYFSINHVTIQVEKNNDNGCKASVQC